MNDQKKPLNNTKIKCEKTTMRKKKELYTNTNQIPSLKLHVDNKEHMFFFKDCYKTKDINKYFVKHFHNFQQKCCYFY